MRFRIPYKEFLIFLTSLMIFLIIGEIAIRLYLRKHIIYDVEMSRYSLLLKKDSLNPLIGHTHRPNRSARLMNVDVSINSDGFRDREYQTANNNRYRIIFLGDSLTFGWGVEQRYCFASILEAKLNERYPAEVINFGTGNYNTEQEVNLFLEKGLKYRPNKVVLFYFINDAEVTPKKSRLWFLGYSRIITFYWSRMHALINNIFPSRSFQAYYAGLYRKGQEGWIAAKDAFLKLKEICNQNNIELQVVLLPELHYLDTYLFKDEYSRVLSFLKKNVIDCFDLTPKFLNYENPRELWVALDDAHPNELAHELIAKYSLDFILERKISH